MGTFVNLRQVSLVLAVVCAAAGAGAAAPSARCGSGRFWSGDALRCVDCGVCSGPGRELTLRPCDETHDAQCGSLANLHLDWSWMRLRAEKQAALGGEPRSRKKAAPGVGDAPTAAPTAPAPPPPPPAPGVHERINSLSEAEALLREELRHIPPQQRAVHEARLLNFGDDYVLPDHPRLPPPHPHHKDKKKTHKKKRPMRITSFDEYSDFGASGDAPSDLSDDEDMALAAWRRSQRTRAPSTPAPAPPAATTPRPTTPRPPTTTVNLVEDFIVEKEAEQEARAAVDVVATTQTFSTAETIVWDWQAGVLVAAVCACLLFFIVAAVYSCQHAMHFKKLKKHLDADMEQISARLALMAGIGSENLQDSRITTQHNMTSSEKDAFSVGRGDQLHSGRQQNEYCLATLPRKSRV